MQSDSKDTTAIVERIASSNCPHCGDEIDVAELAPFSHAECPHCGKDLVVPAMLGPFLLLDVIGAGGMGGVYRAVDQTLGRQVAIKVMLSSLGDNREFIETFKREAQAAAKLNHPHIAQIYSFGEEKGQPYIVMELVDGRGLDKLIESGKSLDQGMVVQIGLDIAEGLHEADQIGLVHGDIKPENILLDEKMNGKLVDFGIASLAGQGASEGIWGTPYYIAPEKLRRQPTDARSDIYCLGATLFHALTGRPPFEGETPVEVVKARLETEPPPLHELRSDIDEDIEPIIARMLRMEPANRYPNYTSLISDMQKVVQKLKPDREKAMKSKKILVRKRGSAVIRGPGGSSTTTGSIAKEVEAIKSSHEDEEPTEEDKVRLKAMVKKLIWVPIGILVLFGVLGGGIFLKIRHDKQIAARRAYLALAAARQNTESAHAKLKETVASIVRRAAAADPIIVKVTNIVTTVTEQSAADLVERLELESPRFDPAAAEAAAEEEEKESEAADEQEAAGSEESTNAVSSQAGQATNEAATGTAVTTNAVVEETVEPVVPEPQEPEPEEPEPAVDEPEIRLLAIDVFAEVLRIRGCVAEARETEFEADRVLKEAAAGKKASDVAPNVPILERMLGSLSGKKEVINKALDRAASVLRRMEGVKVRALRLRAEEEEQRRRDEEKRRMEEEKEKREREHQELVAGEMVQVNSAAAEVRPLLKEYRYSQAMRDMERPLRDLRTDEAKEGLQVFIDRYDRLHKFKLFLIKQLNEDPFKWGWIQSGSPEDIAGASISHVKLRGRIVPWREVSAKQMVYFIRRYVTRANDTVDLRELGDCALASAIFCYENGGYDAAAFYKEKALEFYSRIRKEADRLVPDESPENGQSSNDR